MSVPGYTVGDTSITVGSTSNWSTDTGVTFAIDQAQVVNGVEVQIAGTYNEYVGTVASGTSVSNVSWATGSGNRNYSAGALTRVYIPVSATRENRIVDWGLAHANQDGTLKNNSVGTSQLTDKSVTTSKINGGTTAGVLTTDGSGNVTSVSASPFKIGVTTNFTTAGTKVITGVGFRPKAIRFYLVTGSAAIAYSAQGSYDGTSHFSVSCAVTGAARAQFSSASAIVFVNEASAGVCSFVVTSLDADGFTCNVTSVSAGGANWYWEAWR